jgi:hypothetical protein
MTKCIFYLVVDDFVVQICCHICELNKNKKRGEDADLAWEPSPAFRRHHLKQLFFRRVFHAEKDLPLTFARQLMVLAPNLQAVTLGVRSLKCPACLAA